MIPASNLIGHSAAKWSKTQPHEGIWWTNKLSQGVGGWDKSYIAYSPSKKRLIYVSQVWNIDRQMVRWVVGNTRESYDDLEEAKQAVKEMLK